MIPKSSVEGGAAGRLGYYDFGETPYFASRADARFSYCLYVPQSFEQKIPIDAALVVLVHGTARWAEQYRSAFAEFCERERAIVLAPLFPAGITEPGELSSYKLLRHGGIDYDLILLDMVAEVVERYRLKPDMGFLLHGFSGGSHFAHRFLYLHPERLAGVSIGAPGIVTVIDFEHDYWVGLRDFEARFGKPFDLDAARRVPVQFVIGAEDKETWEIRLTPEDRWWMRGAERLAEANRLERMAALRQSFEDHGIACQQDVVPGVGHDGRAMLGAVQRWMSQTLTAWRMTLE